MKNGVILKKQSNFSQKSLLLICFLFALSTVVSAFDVNDEIELTQIRNARTSARFNTNDANVKGTLAKGTRGKVKEVRKFSSGNSGVLIEVKDGILKNETVWVHFNPNSPSLKLMDEKDKPVAKVDDAKSVKTTRKVDVIREPAAVVPNPAPATADKIPGQITRINQDVAKVNSGPAACTTCGPQPWDAGHERTLRPGVKVAVSNGVINARIKCTNSDKYNQTLPGQIEVIIENNKVMHLDARTAGCRVTLNEFKQIEMPNKAIVLTNSQDCSITIIEDNNSPNQSSPTIRFGVSIADPGCVKFCPNITKRMWQIEMNPSNQRCE